ncbi:hypothetical protein Tco_1152772 [Tanacetum coccineum]
MQDDSIPVEQVHLSDDEDSETDHQSKADSRKDWWKPLPKEERPATPKPTWTIPSSNKSDVANNWASALAITYCQDWRHDDFLKMDCHKMLTDQVNWVNPEGDQVRINVNRPLPLGGPLGYVTIQTQFFFNKDLEYLRYGSKGSCPALSISKMKATNYPNISLELLVPEQMWIDDVCTYDITAKYGISHWWFTRQKFYIDRHDSPSRRKDVRTHMRILNVVRIKAYSRTGMNYFERKLTSEELITKNTTIATRDFKKLISQWTLKTLNLLSFHKGQSTIRGLLVSAKRGIYGTMRASDSNWCTGGHATYILSVISCAGLTGGGKGVLRCQTSGLSQYEFKHDYTIIESPRAVGFPINNNERKIMRFNEIYKFSDGTLTHILEALDYRVKEFKIKRLNPGFPAQSVGSSNTDVLDSPCLLVLITGTSQSRQHGKSESDSYYLSD